MTFTSVDANIFAEANLEIANENLDWGFGWENFAFNFILMCNAWVFNFVLVFGFYNLKMEFKFRKGQFIFIAATV